MALPVVSPFRGPDRPPRWSAPRPRFRVVCAILP